jgi:23S rRNA U2552 (ribose-2'-O)-methylase RlmE/FtsJ
MSLWSEFLTNEQRVIHKWKHYFPAYERHFGKFVNTDVVFIEIGCGQGGSLQMWKRFLGPHARIIGVDINPDCAAFKEDQIEIRIGHQSDAVLLESIVQEFGLPDVVLDDGSHVMSHIQSTSTRSIRSCDAMACTLWRICTPLTGTSMKAAISVKVLSSRPARTTLMSSMRNTHGTH